MQKQTLLFCFLLFSLLFVSLPWVWEIPLVTAATEITLPYTISVSGSYLITAANPAITGVGLTISASDVYVDGQNYLQTQADGNNTIVATSRSNITIVNFNQNRTTLGTTGQYGFLLTTINSSLIANSTFRRNYDNYVSGNSNNYTIDGCIFDQTAYHGFKSYAVGYDHHNFTIRNSMAINSTYWGFTSQNCYNFTWENLTTIDTSSTAGAYGFITDGTNHDYTIRNCNSTSDYRAFSLLDARNVTIDRLVIYQPDGNTSINLQNVTNAVLKKVNVTMIGATGNCVQFADSAEDCNNVTLQQCNFTKGLYGVYTANGNNTYYTLNHFVSQSKPIYEAAGVNHTVLHNAYTGNSSASTIVADGRVINDTALALTVSKVGEGTISPVSGVHAINGGNWSVIATASPDPSYILTSIQLNGVTVSVTSPVTMEVIIDSTLITTFSSETTELTLSHSITLTFATSTELTWNFARYSSQTITFADSTLKLVAWNPHATLPIAFALNNILSVLTRIMTLYGGIILTFATDASENFAYPGSNILNIWSIIPLAYQWWLHAPMPSTLTDVILQLQEATEIAAVGGVLALAGGAVAVAGGAIIISRRRRREED